MSLLRGYVSLKCEEDGGELGEVMLCSVDRCVYYGEGVEWLSKIGDVSKRNVVVSEVSKYIGREKRTKGFCAMKDGAGL